MAESIEMQAYRRYIREEFCPALESKQVTEALVERGDDLFAALTLTERLAFRNQTLQILAEECGNV